jgi:hypothetical protein
LEIAETRQNPSEILFAGLLPIKSILSSLGSFDDFWLLVNGLGLGRQIIPFLRL